MNSPWHIKTIRLSSPNLWGLSESCITVWCGALTLKGHRFKLGSRTPQVEIWTGTYTSVENELFIPTIHPISLCGKVQYHLSRTVYRVSDNLPSWGFTALDDTRVSKRESKHKTVHCLLMCFLESQMSPDLSRPIAVPSKLLEWAGQAVFKFH